MAIEAGRFVGWDWDPKAGINRWFGDVSGIFGISSGTYFAEMGEFLNRVHPDDRDFVWQSIDAARQNRETYTAEFRIPREHGTIQWVIARGKFYYASNGDAARMLGLAMDITERKQMEDAISGMSRKLLEAQEEERARIGRELHDDINQRIALIAIELDLLRNDPSNIDTRLEALGLQIIDLCRDVQGLSHELHSTKLRYLGVVAAVKEWCLEFAERQKINVQFRSDVSSAVPLEIGFCLLRVLQEALSNAAKHGGAKQIEVQLKERSDEVHMIVSDSGTGFNTETAQQGRGIGLSSMQERVRLVHGVIVIDSKPLVGTTVLVRIPLKWEGTLHKAAG